MKRAKFFSIAICAIMILAGCASSQPNQTKVVSSGPPPIRGNLRDARFAATATTLRNRRVLIAGGVASEGAAGSTAELYDPVMGGFVLTGAMLSGRAYYTATLLLDGRVLMVGGVGKDGRPVRAAEIYDPASAEFEPTGNLTQPRYNHTATLLPNGKVLITGGEVTTVGVTVIGTAELYDPASGTFSATGNVTRLYDPEVGQFFFEGRMVAKRTKHTATLLANGKVLIAGGADADSKSLASTEIYDPATGKFTAGPAMASPRKEHRATLLADAAVLISGGLDASDHVLATAEIYEPTTGQFTLIAAQMSDGRADHTATLTPYGRVLIAGGIDSVGALATAELYQPASRSFVCLGGRRPGVTTACSDTMLEARNYASAAALPDGRVLIVGGYNYKQSGAHNPLAAQAAAGSPFVPFNLINSGEIFDAAAGAFTPTQAVIEPRSGAASKR